MVISSMIHLFTDPCFLWEGQEFLAREGCCLFCRLPFLIVVSAGQSDQFLGVMYISWSGAHFGYSLHFYFEGLPCFPPILEFPAYYTIPSSF